MEETHELSLSECIWLVRPGNGNKIAAAALNKNCIEGVRRTWKRISDENGAIHKFWQCDQKATEMFLSPRIPLRGKFLLYRLFPKGECPFTAELFLEVG